MVHQLSVTYLSNLLNPVCLMEVLAMNADQISFITLMEPIPSLEIDGTCHISTPDNNRTFSSSVKACTRVSISLVAILNAEIEARTDVSRGRNRDFFVASVVVYDPVHLASDSKGMSPGTLADRTSPIWLFEEPIK